MMSTSASADEEELRAELRKKERDLLLAARYGKGLLEENERIKRDLENARQEHANAMELLETQRRESQRSLNESRQTAEQHISEMEQQLADLKNELITERATVSSLKEEHARSMEQLQAENLQLREGLAAKASEELEGERCQHSVAELTKKLEESEKRVQQLTLESTELQKQLEIVQESNKTLNVDLSTLADSCDQLTSELVTCREEVEYWEKKYKDKDKELDTCSKDLDDSQELLNQLQIELEQQSTCTPKSGHSGSHPASLYDELCSSRDSLSYMGLVQSEDLSSSCGSDEAEREDDTTSTNGRIHNSSPNLLHRQSTLVLPDKFSQSVRYGWTVGDVFECQRCEELKKKLASNEEELKWVNEQLLMAVQQKFKLQQQIEDWQTDMTQVVEQQVQRKLVKGGASSSSVKRTNTKSKGKKPAAAQPIERQLSIHMIKDSMVF